MHNTLHVVRGLVFTDFRRMFSFTLIKVEEKEREKIFKNSVRV